MRVAALDDVTPLARLGRPRTGETWQTPAPAPDAPALVMDQYLDRTTLRVGTRGDAAIYLVHGESHYGGAPVYGLFEVDAAGARLIACPSPLTTEPCSDNGQWLAPGVSVDTDTFYDSVAIPAQVDLASGFRVTTGHTVAMYREYHQTSDGTRPQQILGDAWYLAGDVLRGDVDLIDVDGGGLSGLVDIRSAGQFGGLVNSRLAWRMPFGTLLELDGRDVPGGNFNAIVWDDKVSRPAHSWLEDGAATTASPGSGACSGAMFSVDPAFKASQWRQAGTTPDGHHVYVPLAGGNARSQEVRAWNEEHSWSWDETGAEQTGAQAYAQTGFSTDEAFLKANALFAMQAWDGRWLLGMSPAAGQVVYECA